MIGLWKTWCDEFWIARKCHLLRDRFDGHKLPANVLEFSRMSSQASTGPDPYPARSPRLDFQQGVAK
jgi:hypothetical protein